MRTHNKTAGLLFLAVSSVYVGQALGQSPATPATSETTAVDPFDTTTIDAARRGTSVKDTDVNFDVDHGTVEIHVNEAPLVEVLRMLSIQSQRNIVASRDVRGNVTANLYGVTVREALDALLHANGYAYREKGNFIYVYTLKEIQEQERAERKLTTEVFRLHYTPASNAVNMIKPVLSNDAQVSFTTPATAGLTGTETGGNSHAVEDLIVVTDYADNLAKVKSVLKEVDRRPQQILVEATIVRAALSDDNALGVDFNILAGVNFNSFNFNQGAQITNGTPATGGGLGSGVGSVGTGNNFTNNINGGLKLGFVSDNVSVFLSALEAVTDTTVLANPKVLALNKQRGEVIVGRKDGYYTTTVTESSTVQTVEFLETGTKLYFRPFIGDDGYVRMEIHPEDSSGGLTSSNLPFKITTEVTSNVMVRDGHTIVIGGLFRESSDTSRSQVPLLGNIPVAGTLFRQQRDRTSREEIIILLTPHIIKDQAKYAQLSEEQLKQAELLRVGVRQGMMPWGRERMAESEYRHALEELGKPNADQSKALWHLQCAINLNPKFTEALKLRQDLTGKQIANTDNSSIRHFVREAMLRDVAEPVAATPMVTDAPLADSTESLDDTEEVSEPTTQPTTQPMAEVKSTPPASVDWTRWVVDAFRFTARALPAASPVPAKVAGAPSVTITELPDDAEASVDPGK